MSNKPKTHLLNYGMQGQKQYLCYSKGTDKKNMTMKLKEVDCSNCKKILNGQRKP